MTPYYADEFATLYLGDCLPVLTSLPTGSAGLVVTDPPYGVEWESNRRAESFGVIHGDGAADRPAIRLALTECVRVVAHHRHLYVFGPQDALDGLKVSQVVELIWNKGTMGSGDLSSAWGPAHERINFTISKQKNAGKTGAPSLPARLRKHTVLTYNRPTGRKVRGPSEKPVPLLRELIESSSRQGDVVLDPYAGVGSTGVAATLTGRRSVLAELDERWAEIAATRLALAADLARAGAAV